MGKIEMIMLRKKNVITYEVIKENVKNDRVFVVAGEKALEIISSKCQNFLFSILLASSSSLPRFVPLFHLISHCIHSI